VATGLRPRGASGRLTARLLAPGIDQLAGREWVLVGPAGGPFTRYGLLEHHEYDDKVVIRLLGVDGPEAARALAGMDILLPCKGLVDLPEGSYYIFELVGLRVVTLAGRALGTVRDVVETGGTPLLAVRPDPGVGDGREEILLPVARSICRIIDTRSGLITIDPPEGLLELYGV
jgi:16S rRNA processing protein RimM